MDIKTAPNPMVVVKNFSQSQADLSRLDGQLTQWQSTGRTYPDPTVEDIFDGIASRLDDSAMDLHDLHPENAQLLESLKKDTLDIARNSGTVGNMAQHRSVFGSGWSTALDQPIVDVRKALDQATQPGVPSDIKPPDPLKLVKNLSDVEASLSGMSGSLAQWQSNGHTYPNRDVEGRFDQMASNLYDARVALRTLHPESKDLLEALKRDTLNVSADAGNISAMADHRQTFGSGWSTTLEHPIAHVREAIGLLTGTN